MSDRKPLMPKATAVWLVSNTALTFEQIAAFCGLHVLEVKGIADGDVAQGIKGLDPVTSNQLTREEIERAEKKSRPRPPPVGNEGRCRPVRHRQEVAALHTAVAPPRTSQRRSLAAAQPSGNQRQPDHAPRRHHQDDDWPGSRPLTLELAQPRPPGPGDARPVLADRPRRRSQEGRPPCRTRAQGKRSRSAEGRHAALGSSRSAAPRRWSIPSASSRSCAPRAM
jgi:hypothetical protein